MSTITRARPSALVVALLALVFFGAAAAMGTQASDEPLFIAGTTTTVAALFNPLRKRVLGFVERRFNRSAYDAEVVMNGFAASLRNRVDSESVVGGWVSVVSETMQPATISVWTRKP